MAELALGFGSSHGSLLVTSPENWDGRAAADRLNKALSYRGRFYTFDELLQLRKERGYLAQAALDARREQYFRCQRQLDTLAKILADAAPDIVLIVGDDQHEWFSESVQPPFAVFCGGRVENLAATDEEIKAHHAQGRLLDPLGYHPAMDTSYPVARELAEHIIALSIRDGFDIAACITQPKVNGQLTNLGHAYGFIYRRILRDRATPMVPVLVNTFYPPNQPTVRRCIEFGRGIGRAVKSWPSKARVAVCASGGLSHFVIDEEFDDVILTALKKSDYQKLADQPEEMFQSGTSEIKNWLVVAGILAESSLDMTLLDYVPCFRTEAGTGNAMAFAVWR